MRDRFVHVLLLAVALAGSGAPARAGDMPPLELIDSNLIETPYTAHVRIDSIDTAKDGAGGYVTFHVHATVAETFKGQARPQVDYFETHDAPSAGPQPGSDIVISLEKLDDGNYAVPDNGYVFPATRAVLERARRAGKAITRSSRRQR